MREHGLAWIAPLAPALLKTDLAFANGFVERATVRDLAPGVFAPLASAREWSTIRSLDVTNWRFRDHAAALALPHVRNLRIDGISRLAHVPRAAARLDRLTIEGMFAGEIPALEREAAAWPALRALTLEAYIDSLAELVSLRTRHPAPAPFGQLAELAITIGSRWSGWSIAFAYEHDAIAVTFDDRALTGADRGANRNTALRALLAAAARDRRACHARLQHTTAGARAGRDLGRDRAAGAIEPRHRTTDGSLPNRNELVMTLRSWGKATSDHSERRFLSGPRPRGSELVFAIDVFREMVRGFRALHFVGPCVTVFGSARFDSHHPYYDLARRTGTELANAGFTVMTGGGPGVMEAANRGAREAGGRSVGCNIVLPVEQEPNAYLDRFVECRYFFVRKLLLAKYSYAFIAAPGGYGTLDELAEVLVLIQTQKMKSFPVVLLGRDYWSGLLAFFRDTLVAQATISQADLDRLVITDDPAEAVRAIRDVAMSEFGLTYGPRARRRWWLGE